MKQIVLFFLLFLSIQVPVLKAIEFSAKEKSIIYTNTIKVLENYQTVINQMGEFVVNDIEKAKSSSESFLELFVNRQVLIYNDLDPAHKLSEFYEAETYSSNIILWYPDGLSIQLDLGNAKVSEIMTHEENVYSIDIMAKKTMNGNYLNQTLNKNVEELTFRIAFGLENKSLTNFKIVGIRSAASNYVIDYSKALKEVNSEDFNAEDLGKIQSELKTLLKDYANFLSLIGDPQEQNDDKEFYKTSFLKLFQSNDTRLYNDITPEPQTSLISVTEYLSGFVSDYPNGIKNISINGDSAKFGKVMKAGEGSYYTYVDANKFFSGSFKGKDVFRKMFPLIFKISFNASGKTFNGFAINGIDISSVNFYQATNGTAAEQKPEITIKPVTRKGLVLSLTGSFGQTQINSLDITSLSLAQDLHSWTVSPLYGYLTAVGVSYYFTDNIALKSGVEFNKYSSKFNLTGNFTANTLSADINGHSFYKMVSAGYDSLVTVNYLTLPVLVSYTSGKPGKPGFYAEGGVKISIPVHASYSNTGYYKTSGYYPANPAATDTLSLSELGFYSRENISDTKTINLKGFNLAIYGSVGVNIPLGYYSSINIGPEMIIGLSDIMSNDKKYTDIFGKTYTHQPTKIKNFGIRISFAYKL
jgi:hypothetical protein